MFPGVLLILIMMVFAVLIATAAQHRRHSMQTAQKLCRSCGTNHPGFAQFCRRCGMRL